ncbi:centromere protein M isoform X1 [Gracilinanus agilis]|uniref:centromere protein M isoform X1 n=1 Tax=Gracilinanus agilis TaxID=191870 RepID=UPI001CFF2F80|nr:centromere protein M isoform X1 [Gracilinanus agilis]
MALLRPLDKLPTLDVATILLVGAEEKLLERLGEAILREGEGTAKVQVHVAPGLPLPADRECFRPRVDLVVFVLSLHSKHSLRTVEASLPQLDAGFFLGKVCFLANGDPSPGLRAPFRARTPLRPAVPRCSGLSSRPRLGGGSQAKAPPNQRPVCPLSWKRAECQHPHGRRCENGHGLLQPSSLW